MSFEIPDIQKVRDGTYENEYKSLYASQSSDLETRVNKWIEGINYSIKFDNTGYNGTAWEMELDAHDIFQHPKFQLYIEKLVQAGYTVKITKPPITLFNIYWEPDMKPELIWYDYDEDMAEHRYKMKRLRYNQTLRYTGYFVLTSILIVLLAIGARFKN